ncbi:MAG: hypothetical protein C4575_07055 [Desulforudis sp.]|nr:MAG: hypothetical protein C4575_07055 [Desulforudis sp.]
MYLFLSVTLAAAGHLLAKAGVTRSGAGLNALLDPFVVLGIGCFFLSMVCFLPWLASRPVGVAVPAAGLTYALVALAAWALKGDVLSLEQWGGIALIGFGVYLVNN